MSQEIFGFLDVPGIDRSKKPRGAGRTVVQTRGFVPDYVLEGYSEYIDVIKMTNRILWAPDEFIQKHINRYKDHGVELQLGGIAGEIARLNGQKEEYRDAQQETGIDWVEYETHVEEASADEIEHEVGLLKDQGFRVAGEVGARWWWHDATRRSISDVDVDTTVNRIQAFLDAGCEYVYWDGLIPPNLIGKDLNNAIGQKALHQVVDRIGVENIIFEVWGPGLEHMEYSRYWSWLIHEFGPEVNVGNVPPVGVLELENLRRGLGLDMDYPYIRWENEDRPTEDWWRMDAPPYSEGIGTEVWNSSE